VSEGKSGRGFGLVTSIILFAVIFAVVVLSIYVFAVVVLWIYERIKRLWWNWKARKEDPLWRLRKAKHSWSPAGSCSS
jgi:hypothetical protein